MPKFCFVSQMDMTVVWVCFVPGHDSVCVRVCVCVCVYERLCTVPDYERLVFAIA